MVRFGEDWVRVDVARQLDVGRHPACLLCDSCSCAAVTHIDGDVNPDSTISAAPVVVGLKIKSRVAITIGGNFDSLRIDSVLHNSNGSGLDVDPVEIAIVCVEWIVPPEVDVADSPGWVADFQL